MHLATHINTRIKVKAFLQRTSTEHTTATEEVRGLKQSFRINIYDVKGTSIVSTSNGALKLKDQSTFNREAKLTQLNPGKQKRRSKLLGEHMQKIRSGREALHSLGKINCDTQKADNTHNTKCECAADNAPSPST